MHKSNDPTRDFVPRGVPLPGLQLPVYAYTIPSVVWLVHSEPAGFVPTVLVPKMNHGPPPLVAAAAACVISSFPVSLKTRLLNLSSSQ